MDYKFSKWDERRQIAIGGNYAHTVALAVKHFIDVAKDSISSHGSFFVALSGGSTPKAMFEKLSQEPYKSQIDWSKVYLFWSDERSVSPDDPESNYKMAMDAGFSSIGIPSENIHRMVAEKEIEKNAALYESTIKQVLKDRPFDLIMLGMGDDGHTASLFPHTNALHITDKLIAANHVPQKNTWRMTMTFELINSARNTVIYVLGASKKQMVHRIFFEKEQFDELPIQKVGTKQHPALWIIDEAAADLFIKDAHRNC